MRVIGNCWVKQEIFSFGRRIRVLDVKNWNLRKLKVVLDYTPIKRNKDFIIKDRKIHFKFLVPEFTTILLWE